MEKMFGTTRANIFLFRTIKRPTMRLFIPLKINVSGMSVVQTTEISLNLYPIQRMKQCIVHKHDVPRAVRKRSVFQLKIPAWKSERHTAVGVAKLATTERPAKSPFHKDVHCFKLRCTIAFVGLFEHSLSYEAQ
jgi:hypothetical protein